MRHGQHFRNLTFYRNKNIWSQHMTRLKKLKMFRCETNASTKAKVTEHWFIHNALS